MSLTGPGPLPEVPRSRLLSGALSRSRLAAGMAAALALPAVVTVSLQRAGWIGASGHSLLYVLAVVVTALLGGIWPALLCSVVSSIALNWFFIEPVHTLRITAPHDVTTLLVFVLVAAIVSAVVHHAASLAARAQRAAAESHALSAIAGGIMRTDEALPALLCETRAAFGMTSVALLRRTPRGWLVNDSVGPQPPTTPQQADVTATAGADLVLALSGRGLGLDDVRLLQAFASQVEGLAERDRLAGEAAAAAKLEASDRMRNALLAALGHDLRRPLASATAAVDGLRGPVALSAAERVELLETAAQSLHRLALLVDDLLDLSRLQAGVLQPVSAPVWLDELISPAIDDATGLGAGPGAADGAPVVIDVSDDVPAVDADAALVARVLANLVANAVRHAAGQPVRVWAESTSAAVSVHVTDHGPGISPAEREVAFRPFQRRGDIDNRTGLGLGLALSRGLAEAMGGSVTLTDTPGGGTTATLTLPRSEAT